MKKFVFLAVVILGVSGLSACSTATNAATFDIGKYESQSISWESCDTEYGAKLTTSKAFKDADKVDCAKVLVPAIYSADSKNKDYAIAMMRLNTASSSDYLGTLFINPGGPGGSGIEQVMTSEFPSELTKHFNIIGFDPRGVKYSTFSDGTEIKCSDQLDYNSYFTTEGSPANDEEVAAVEKILQEYYTDCAKNNPLWWTMSTTNVVRDLEIMRKVITKDEPLNFIGSSYGTTIASVYVSTYPEHVGKIVLDSPTSTRENLVSDAVENLKSQEAKLNMLLAAYAKDKGITVEAAFKTLLEMKQLADDNQLIGSLGITPSPIDETRTISPESLFRKGLFAMNYLPEDQAKSEFIAAMDSLTNYHDNLYFEWYGLAMDGYDPEALRRSNKSLVRSNTFEVMDIVNSLDYSPEEFTEAENRDYFALAKKTAPRMMALTTDSSGYLSFKPSKVVDWRALALEEDSIPDPSATPLARENKSGKPLLIVGSINESVTPYAFSKETATLMKSPLVSVKDSVHAPAAYYNNSCVNEILIDYFVKNKEIKNTTCNK